MADGWFSRWYRGWQQDTIARQERTTRHPIATACLLSLAVFVTALTWTVPRWGWWPGIAAALAFGALVGPAAVLEAMRRVRRRERP